MPPPFYGRGPKDGLHILKDAWGQKKYMGQQSKFLANQLSIAIRATFKAAHIRNRSFELDRPLNLAMNDRSQERRLEAAMIRRWNRVDMWPIPGGWTRIVSCQTPLFARQQQEQWGSIDLLGMDAGRLPVVIELKKAPNANSDGTTTNTETPLRMLLEAAAYAVALRKNWKRFREEWIARLTALDISKSISSQVPQELTTVPLVAAAPASFWIDWLPVTKKGSTVSKDTWKSFKALLDELAKEKLPVSFVSISGNYQDINGLAVQPLVDFPLID